MSVLKNLLVSLMLSSGAAQGAVIFNDTFEGATLGAGAVGGKDAANPGSDPADIGWYARGQVDGNLSIVADSFAGGVSTQALRINGTNSQQMYLGSFDSVMSDNTIGNNNRLTHLTNVNERLTLSFDFRFENAPANGTFRMGLFGDPDHFITASGTNSPNTTTVTDNSVGYFFSINQGANATQVSLYSESGTNTFLLFGSDITLLTDGPTLGATGISNTNLTSFSFQLTRTSIDDVTVELFRDDTLFASKTAPASSLPSSGFNLVALYSSVTSTYLLDNVKLEASVIPEPSTITLAALGLGGLAVQSLRRRKTQAR